MMLSHEGEKLRGLLRGARRHRLLMLALRGAAVCLCAGAVVLLLTGWAAYRFRRQEGALLLLRLGALVAFLSAVYFSLVRPLARRVSDLRLARWIEERTPGTEDRFVAAVELDEGASGARVPRALAERLRSDADAVAAGVDVGVVCGKRRLGTYAACALAGLLFFAGVLRFGPRGVTEGVAQLITPSALAGEEAEAGAFSIKVKPGSARVPKGSDQEIAATLAGFDSEVATFFSRPPGAGDENWQAQGMEQAKARGDFQLSLFNVQESAEYFVESNGVRSEVFKLTVVDLPFVKQLD